MEEQEIPKPLVVAAIIAGLIVAPKFTIVAVFVFALLYAIVAIGMEP